MISDSELGEMTEWLKNQPFEPFGDLEILMRKKMPDLFMEMARICFGDGDGTMNEAALVHAQQQLHLHLMHIAHLAENGMVAKLHDYKFEPHGTTVGYLLRSMKRAFGDGGTQEQRDKIHRDLDCLLPWIEIGLALPTSDAKQ